MTKNKKGKQNERNRCSNILMFVFVQTKKKFNLLIHFVKTHKHQQQQHNRTPNDSTAPDRTAPDRTAWIGTCRGERIGNLFVIADYSYA